MPNFFKLANIGMIRPLLSRSFWNNISKRNADVTISAPPKQNPPPQALSPLEAWRRGLTKQDRLIHDLAKEGESECVDTTFKIK